VIDYRQVDAKLGDWEDVAKIGADFRLMYDGVINHISRQSAWFRGYLCDEKPYQDYFITVDPSTDLSQVVRPRALPLLTEVKTVSGNRHVWTTFSDDQIDLNYSNPDVLLEILDLLLFYISSGAEIIRLDAVAYLWKQVGTPSIHLPQTHTVIKLMRAMLDAVAPWALLITETNVPHEENISYFGEVRSDTGRTDEAQLVYQFPLAPLVLHTFQVGDAGILNQWASQLEAVAPFFNFIASHDGIGVMPARGLLSETQIQYLVDQTLRHGGQVSYKTNPDGTRSVYELNITLFDWLNDPNSPNPEVDLRRFLASQVIMLSLAGVPGIYWHSLFGLRNCYDCVEETGRARSINREKFQAEDLKAELVKPESQQRRVFESYCHLLRQRRAHPAFHPEGGQRVLPLNEAVFCLLREAPTNAEAVLCLINVSEKHQRVRFEAGEWGHGEAREWHDLIAGRTYTSASVVQDFPLEGYQTMWLRKNKGAK
jgi:sucrose phosphorylase